MAPSRREVEKARREYARSLNKAVASAAKGTEWRARDGCPFAVRNGWFAVAAPLVSFQQEQTQARIEIRPMSIDPIFWAIIGHPELERQPISLRINGLVCRVPPLEIVTVLGDPDPDAAAASLIAAADEGLDQGIAMGLPGFVDFCRCKATTCRTYLTTIIPTLIADGLIEEAQREAHNAIAASISGGFRGNGKAFPELVIDYLAKR